MKAKHLLLLSLSLLAAALVHAQAEKISLNENWRFHLGDIPTASATYFNDADWEMLNLPHTWNTDAYTVKDYHQGTGWYRHALTIPAAWQAKRLYLCFEGAGKAATLYINGKQVGEHAGGYTAFNFDITDHVDAKGPNILAVKVSNDRDDIVPTSADFTFFGGIYRDVWLTASENIHFDRTDMASDGIFVTTPAVSAQQATVSIRGKLKNETADKQDLNIEYTLLSPDGAPVQTQTQRVQVKGGEDLAFQSKDILVSAPRLWTPETPHLYQVRITLKNRKTGKTIDQQQLPAAFRWYSFDAAQGFMLNGSPYKLRGMCRHQDQQPIGSALTDEMHRRDMLLIKQMGANFIRISHYPQDEAILEMCDKLGLLVWEEIPIVNLVPDTPGFNENAERNLREMIRQHYNHPSVILWGYMNEILLVTTRLPEAQRQPGIDRALALAKHLEEVVHEEDPTRLSTMAFHGSEDYNTFGFSGITDVVGWNIYNGWYGADLADFDHFMADQHQRYPTHPLIVSEYGAGSDKRIHSLSPVRFDFSTEYQQKYIEHYVPHIEATPYIMGGTYWNFIDFSSATREESMPRINNKGLVRADREPKDVYYYFKAAWRSDIPVLHIATRDWDVRTAVQDNAAPAVQPVKVYTNLASVELLLNGQSLGSKAVSNHFALFDVPFQPGEPVLTARGTYQGQPVEDAVRIRFNVVPRTITPANVEGLELGVNVGSNCFFTSDVSGFTWVPDQPYAEGSWGYLSGTDKSSTTEIRATYDGPLFQTQKTDIEGYRFDVPQGTYEVELLFADLSAGDSRAAYLLSDDTRKNSAFSTFNVNFNGQVVDVLSPKASGGPFTAMRKTYIVKNDTDHIEVCLDAAEGTTFLNGIKIRKIKN